MSTLHFKWGWGRRLAGHVSSLLRTVRPRSSLPGPVQGPSARPEKGEDRTKNRPIRTGQLSRAKSVGASSRDKSALGPGSRMESISRREKGKRRADMASAPGVLSGRSKSIERWPMPIDIGPPSDRMTTPGRKLRRGSETHPVSPGPFQFGSAPQSSSPIHIQGDERLRNKFTLSSIWKWRPRYSPHATSPVDSPVSSWPSNTNGYMPPSLRNGVQTATSADPFSRRSEEALRHNRTVQSPVLTGSLTAARRASSWGENPTDYMAADVASLNSDELDLDEQAMILGAGGVSDERTILTWNAQGVSVVDHPGPSSSSASARQPQTPRTFGYASPPLLDAQSRCPGLSRYRNASPLTQVAYESAPSSQVYHIDVDVDVDVDDDDDDDAHDVYSSSLEDFDELDDSDGEDEDEDAVPLEVRRRPLVSPPPPHPESSGDEMC